MVGAREHQDARGVHVGVLALPERGVHREREHVRHVLAQPVEEVDGLLAALYGVVDVQGEGVVAPDQPPQLPLEALVVGLVDDLLLSPVSDRVRPASAEYSAEPLGVPQQDRLRTARSPTTPAGSACTPVFDSISQSMSSPEKRFSGLGGEDLLRPVSELEGPRVGEPQLLFGAQCSLLNARSKASAEMREGLSVMLKVLLRDPAFLHAGEFFARARLRRGDPCR